MSEQARKRKLRRLALFCIRTRLASPEQLAVTAHLSANEIGAALSGGLLRSERLRMEGHISCCDRCAGILKDLFDAEREGSRPQFLPRRPVTRTATQRLSTRLTRRYSHLILALVAFLLVILIPISQGWLTGKEHLVLKEKALVVDRVGTPVTTRAGGDVQAAVTGGWLEAKDQLVLEAGDTVRVLKANGEVGTITRAGVEWNGVSSAILAEIFQEVEKAPDADLLARRVALRDSSEESVPHFLHPRAIIYSLRPTLLWSVGSRSPRGEVRVEHLRPVEGVPLNPTAQPVRWPKRLLQRSVSTNTLRFPGGELDLEEGGDFIAYLTLDGYPQEVSARFSLLSAKARATMKNELSQLSLVGGRALRYLRAEYFASRECVSEARIEFERLRIADSRNERLMERLLWAYDELGLSTEALALSKLMQEDRR